jgi:hypothetical protein
MSDMHHISYSDIVARHGEAAVQAIVENLEGLQGIHADIGTSLEERWNAVTQNDPVAQIGEEGDLVLVYSDAQMRHEFRRILARNDQHKIEKVIAVVEDINGMLHNSGLSLEQRWIEIMTFDPSRLPLAN